MTPVIRLDSIPIVDKSFFTPEGYFRDSPILTSTGIFEYVNYDGSIRRELRLPEEVFDPDSLTSYQGKPIIITHDAGLIDKRNVDKEQIGTILTEGYEDGDDVRADIVIHNTDAMKNSNLRELSVGYNLDLDERPGVWKGQHYDAIQRNIRVNHLALVRKARAGDQARLNLDSGASITTLKGGKHVMAMKKKRNMDCVLSHEELEKAISDYKAKRAAETGKKSDAVPEAEGAKPDAKKAETPAAVAPKAPAPTAAPTAPTAAAPAAEKPEEKAASDGDDAEITPVPEDAPIEEKVAAIKERSENNDDDEAAHQAVIKQQNYDIGKLLDIIDSLLAERDFNKTGAPKPDTATDGEECEKQPVTDEDDIADNTDEDEFAENNEDEDDEMVEDEDDDIIDVPESAKTEADSDDETGNGDMPKMNTDSIDRMIRKRVKLGMIGKALHLDGLEDMPIRKAEKLVIRVVRPTVRFDGKSGAYIDAMFDCACEEVKAMSAKDTNYQKRQMFNTDGRDRKCKSDSSMSARNRMIKRQLNRNKEVK